MDDLDDEPRRPLTAAIAAWIWIVHGGVILLAIVSFIVWIVVLEYRNPSVIFCFSLPCSLFGYMAWCVLKRGIVYFQGRIRRPRIDGLISLFIAAIIGLLYVPMAFLYINSQTYDVPTIVIFFIVGIDTNTLVIAGIFAIVSRKAYIRWVLHKRDLDINQRNFRGERREPYV